MVTTALSFAFFLHTWAVPTRNWIGGEGDAVQFIWYSRWLPYALAHGHSGLMSTALNYPIGINFMWDPMPYVPTLLLIPVTLLGGPILSYNLMITLAVPLAAVAAYAACRRWGAGPAGAWAGGLGFAFCPFFAAHSPGHAFLVFTALVPLAFCCVHEVLVRQTWRWWSAGAVLGALAAVTLMTSEEFLAWDALFGVAGVTLIVALRPREVLPRLGYAARAAAAAAVVFSLLAAYPLWVQFAGRLQTSGTGLRSSDLGAVDLLNLFLPAQQAGSAIALRAARHYSPFPMEWTGYLGIPMMLLVAVLLVTAWRQVAVRWTALVTGLVILLALGPHLHIDGRVTTVPLPWLALQRLPLLADAVAARAMVFADLGFAILLALFITALLAHRQRHPVLTAGGFALALVALLSWAPRPVVTGTAPQPAYFTGAVSDLTPQAPVLVLPDTATGPRSSEAMLWQALAGMRFRMPEGYFLMTDGRGRVVFTPPATPLTRPFDALQHGQRVTGSWLETPAFRRQWLATARQMGFRAVIVGPSRWAAADRAYLAWLLGRPPLWRGGVAVWYL
jgi:hypothetical protein